MESLISLSHKSHNPPDWPEAGTTRLSTSRVNQPGKIVHFVAVEAPAHTSTVPGDETHGARGALKAGAAA